MRKIFLALTFILSTMGYAHASEKDIVVEVNGLVCDFCAQSLEKVFGKEDGVNAIAVDLDTQTVIVDVKDGQDLSDEKIKELIEWGGYDLVGIKRVE